MTRILPGACLSVTLSASILAAPPSLPDPVASAALEDLHDGRFDAADATLAASSDPESRLRRSFFSAFVTYWRLIYDDDNDVLRDRFEGQLERTLDLAEARRRTAPDDPEAHLWGGSAHLLTAQLHAAERERFAAAFSAKRAKRALESAANGGGAGAEALFGLGTYNYVADRVPAFVKGIRALLFLPGGNRAKGLEQLGRAARESRYFGLEARLLLVTIYANKTERLFPEALAELAEARKSHPESIAVLDASARLRIALADPEGALDDLDRAERRAQDPGGVDAALLARLRLLRAAAEMVRLRPDRARDALLPLVADRTLPASVLSSAKGRLAEAETMLSSPWWSQAAGADATALVTAARRPDAQPMVALAAGRRAVLDGDAATALELLRSAERSGTLPENWLGACRLWAGRASDLAGDRARAMDFYGRASRGRDFSGREATFLHLRVPYRGRIP